MRFPNRGEAGFTITELLVVIVILGVLAAVAIPLFLNQSDRAEQAALEADISSALALLNAGQAIGATLPASLPANTVTQIPGVGGIEPAVTLTVSGSGDTLCVDGTTPSGVTISNGMTSGVQQASCASFQITVPTAPLALIAAAGDAEVTLAWSAPADDGGSPVTGYNIEYSTTVSGPWTTVGNTPNTTFTAIGLTNGTGFWFRVTALNVAGESVATSTSATPIQPLALSYASTTFTVGANSQTLAATTTGGDGSAKTYSVSGTLPTGVTFDTSTGAFTGPADSTWNGSSAVSTGGAHACALTGAGGLECWGRNLYGETDVPGFATGNGWTAVSAGGNHTCAVTDAGGLQCWGYNNNGQTNVPALASGTEWVSTALGIRHTCGLTDAGGIQCWGRNSNGQSTVPTPASGAEWTAVTAGGYHTCGLTDAGGLQCWGSNSDGQINVPAPATGNGWTEVAAGTYHTCGLTDAGGIQCWGGNSDGQINVPAPATGNGWTEVAPGGYHTCAVTDTGGLQCWGRNDFSQTAAPSPATGTGWTTVAPGGLHTCALTDAGGLQCWGSNSDGQTDVPDALQPAGPFPATVNVTVMDDNGSDTTAVTLILV